MSYLQNHCVQLPFSCGESWSRSEYGGTYTSWMLWVFGSTALQFEDHLAWFHLCCLQTTSHLPWGPSQYADVLLSCLHLLVHLQAKSKWGSECGSSYPDSGVEESVYLPAFVPNDWCQSQEPVSLQSTQDEWQFNGLWGTPSHTKLYFHKY